MSATELPEEKEEHLLIPSFERVEFRNSKGLSLVGDLYRSKSSTGIIIVHGLGSDRHGSRGKFDKLAQDLNKNKHNVLAFDFSGNGESEGDTINVLTEVGDLADAIRFLKDKGVNQLGLVGSSFGGWVSSMVYPEFTEDIKSIVLWAPVTNKMQSSESHYSQDQQQEVEDTGKMTLVDETKKRKKMIVEGQVFKIWNNIDQQVLLSPIKIPVLIIHGDQDERIPYQDSEMAMQYLPIGSDLAIVKGADHSCSDPEYLGQFIKRTKNWFIDHLPC